jgi:hypothetical protein
MSSVGGAGCGESDAHLHWEVPSLRTWHNDDAGTVMFLSINNLYIPGSYHGSSQCGDKRAGVPKLPLMGSPILHHQHGWCFEAHPSEANLHQAC